MFPQWLMPKPTAYGWFHLTFILFCLTTSFLLIRRARKKQHASLKKIVLWLGIFTALIEVYKQLFLLTNFSYYSFNDFPLHYCSMIIYASLLAGLTKNKKIEKALYDFIALYITLPGLAVLLFPGGVFSTYVVLNLHTMLWHSAMVTCSLYILFTHRIEPLLKSLMRTIGLFLALCGVIIFINFFTYHIHFLPQGQPTWFFFIGPYVFYNHPVINWAIATGGWAFYLTLYLLIFTSGAVLLAFVNHIAFKKKTNHSFLS